VRASKETAMQSLDIADLRHAMDNSQYEAIHEMTYSDDFVEGPKAFAEKRKPNWKGK
jgi:crotonobetainyl-CoA hydratase